MIATASANLTDAEFTRLSDLVYKHCGINLHDGKVELVRARLAKQMRVGNFATASEYLEHVLADPTGGEFTRLIDALSTNLTSFFRERNHFDYLQQHFLPKVIAEKQRKGGKRLRAWSAGCSSGEEPYSLAMTLLEATAGGPASGWDVKLLATDISTRVLALAQRGAYDKQRVDGVPPDLRNKYLTASKFEGRTFYDVSRPLQQLIAFRHLNLMQNWPFSGPFDFIFCRNVMIYFDKPTQEKLVGRFHDCLAPGGMLFTGHSESLTGINHRFRYVQPTIYGKAG
jgi:chemotaxis protein methyltransferase CheR